MNIDCHMKKNSQGVYTIYSVYSFDVLYDQLLRKEFDKDEAIDYILANCSLSGNVFQDRIFEQDNLPERKEESFLSESIIVRCQLEQDILECLE